MLRRIRLRPKTGFGGQGAPRNDVDGLEFYGETDLTQTADSYVCGIAEAPLLGNTIGRTLDQAARRWPDREALVSPSHDVRWTWAELAGRVDALAAGFLALGFEPGG